MIISQRVYLTSDGRYVGHGDPDAAFLAYPVGYEISDRLAEQRGLVQFCSSGVPVQPPSVVIGPDTAGRMTMTSVAPPVGTIPPGHATASDSAVPAETADPVANADGTFRGQQVVPPKSAATQPTTSRPAAKPVRTAREV